MLPKIRITYLNIPQYFSVDPPQIVQAFPEEELKAGPAVYLKCVASGNPTPEINWYLDSTKLENNDKYTSHPFCTVTPSPSKV